MTCQSLFGVGDGEGDGDTFALAEDFPDALDFALDLAASEGEASKSESTPAMAKEQRRRPVIYNKDNKGQEGCHKGFAFQLEIGRLWDVQKFSLIVLPRRRGPPGGEAAVSAANETRKCFLRVRTPAATTIG